MKNISSINTFQCLNGDRVSKSIITRNISKAKELKKSNFLKEHDLICCEFTGQSSGTYIDIMHLISVDECQKTGRTNLSWDQRNLRFGTRKIHKLHDAKTNAAREEIFNQLNGL